VFTSVQTSLLLSISQLTYIGESNSKQVSDILIT